MNSDSPRAWRPTVVLRVSALIHATALGACIVHPASWPWALGAVIGNHLLLTALGLWPRSSWLGPNWTHLPHAAGARGEVAITIDDGPDPEVTPRVLDILEHHGVRATFFVIGARTAQHQELAREIVRRGHALENHSYRHTNFFSVLGPHGIAAEVQRTQQIIAAVGGELPRFFRAPAGLRNPLLEPVLAHQNLRLASWTRRGFDTLNRSPDAVLRALTRRLGAGDILLLHDGNAALAPSGLPVILEVLPRLLAVLQSRHLKPVTLRAALE